MPLSAEDIGTNAIMRETGKSKTCVWRWQGRFAAEGVDGLFRDKTRPSRSAKLAPSIAERVVALTTEEPPGDALDRRRWPRLQASALRRCGASGARMDSNRIASGNLSCPKTPSSPTNCATLSGSMSSAGHRAQRRRKEPDPGARLNAAWPAAQERPGWKRNP